MSQRLEFSPWIRSGLFDLTTQTVDGRRRGTVEITLQDRANPADRETQQIPFRVMGPADVQGLAARAVRRMMPPPGSVGAETTKCVHVDLSEPDLPWRYTPEMHAGKVLRPWIVLLVGTDEEIRLSSEGTALIEPPVLVDHPLQLSARWAHLDEGGPEPTARLLSPRELTAEADQVAVIVPAFAADGTDAWPAVPQQAMSLSVYHVWRFRTGEAGDFVTLASALRPLRAPPTLGRAPLRYRRGAVDEELSVRGALAPVGGSDAALPAAVAASLTSLTRPPADPDNRPVVGLPAHGAPWAEPGASPGPAAGGWFGELNTDARARGVAGLGRHSGIELQETLTEAAVAQLGAIDMADARIRNLTAGIEAARRLWRRRFPTDPQHRLYLAGPMLRRMVTPTGSVAERLEADDRPLPAVLFSSVARRVLRHGPARSDRLSAGALEPRRLLADANRCPPLPDKTPDGLPHGDRADSSLDERAAKALETGRLQADILLKRLVQADLRRFDQRVRREIAALITRLREQLEATGGFPHLPVTELIAILEHTKTGDEDVLQALEVFDFRPDGNSILTLIAEILTLRPTRICDPVDLDALANGVIRAIDPTGDNAPAIEQVLDTIGGLDAQPLAPPRLCPDIDLALWRHLRDAHSDWLLPGADQIETDTVVAVETNPGFIDAFLTGINTQLLSELRWRNLSIRSGCTPLRSFWDRIDPATGNRDRDIVGFRQWDPNSSLGAPSHQPPSAAPTDLVLVFRSEIFRRYPDTLVYLLPPVLDAQGDPDWDSDPDFAGGTPVFPVFQGTLPNGATFLGFDVAPPDAPNLWVVMEEPPPGYRFRNRAADVSPQNLADFQTATDGAVFAMAAFAEPSRVLIRGATLVAEDTA